MPEVLGAIPQAIVDLDEAVIMPGSRYLWTRTFRRDGADVVSVHEVEVITPAIVERTGQAAVVCLVKGRRYARVVALAEFETFEQVS